MGNFRRLTNDAAIASVVLITLAACGGNATEKKRRELLKPAAAAIQPQAPKSKPPPTTDADGVPLPSSLVLAGFAVPIGFEVTQSFENEWFLRSTTVSAAAAARYVEARVFTGKLERTSVGGTRFEGSQLRDAPTLPRLSIRISPTKNHKNASEMYIRRIPVQTKVTRTAETVAQTLRDNARFAQ